MTGHGSPPPADRAGHPNRQVGERDLHWAQMDDPRGRQQRSLIDSPFTNTPNATNFLDKPRGVHYGIRYGSKAMGSRAYPGPSIRERVRGSAIATAVLGGMGSKR